MERFQREFQSIIYQNHFCINTFFWQDQKTNYHIQVSCTICDYTVALDLTLNNHNVKR